jgi:GTP-binding protein SAR1
MSSLVKWVYYITTTSFSWIFKTTGLSTKKANLLIIGLDNSGKTTLLCLMAKDKILCHEPTSHPNKEELTIGNISFTAHDLGGHVAARRLWKLYYANTDCVLFMIDTTDYNRMDECRTELTRILSDSNGSPVLVIGNKIDAPGACSKEQLSRYMGIDNDNPNIKLFMCSVVKRSGIQDAFKWLKTKI